MEQDRIEEGNAAAALVLHLSGKPIVETSGDYNHRLNPTIIEFKVGMNKHGEELAISITQTDRHHPRLVYDTIKQELDKLEEFKGLGLKKIDSERDYNQETGEITLRYKTASGAADSIIHSLSEKGEKLMSQIKSNQAQGDTVAAVKGYSSLGQETGMHI
jgi:hypothetical protein